MSDKKFLFAVSFDPKLSRFTVEDASNWVGAPVYDFEDFLSRNFEDDKESGVYYQLEDILQTAVIQVNKVIHSNAEQFDKGL